ncbi:MAG: four helix bundle protein [Pirellulales bacterium]|nr:four helix bundle protein [Pirellulales bacterium]
MAIKECKDLAIYTLSFDCAMDIFRATKDFPKEEKYSLTDQIVRSSRSVPANIREGFAKRKYKEVFARHLNDALGSSEETVTWLDFSLECGYISKEKHSLFVEQYKKIGAMVYKLMSSWQKF